MTPRALREDDFGWVLALSAENEIETGHLDAQRLAAMMRASFRCSAVEAEAYLIAFAPGAAYDSPNFRWFEARRRDFIYVDRVVVAARSRGKGLARLLYEDLSVRANEVGARVIACEVNIDPPNHGSDAFHARMGFTQVGGALLANGKRVRYLERALESVGPEVRVLAD